MSSATLILIGECLAWYLLCAANCWWSRHGQIPWFSTSVLSSTSINLRRRPLNLRSICAGGRDKRNLFLMADSITNRILNRADRDKRYNYNIIFFESVHKKVQRRQVLPKPFGRPETGANLETGDISRPAQSNNKNYKCASNFPTRIFPKSIPPIDGFLPDRAGLGKLLGILLLWQVVHSLLQIHHGDEWLLNWMAHFSTSLTALDWLPKIDSLNWWYHLTMPFLR